MRELIHNVKHDELEGNDLSTPALQLIEQTIKEGGRDADRLAFEQLFGAPEIGVVALTLMQKSASIGDLTLYRAAELVCPENPVHLYEELGGGYKLAGRFDRAKGLSRVGELLSGSRAKTLDKAKEEATIEAGKHLLGALKHKSNPEHVGEVMKALHSKSPIPDHLKETALHAEHVHKNNIASTRASRVGKVLKAEKSKVLGTRAGAGAVGAAGVASGAAAIHNKSSDSKKK